MIDIVWKGSPRWWASGRAGTLLYVVMHDTEGHAGATAAEAGIAYDKTRPDSVSTHIFVDSKGDALREVQDTDTAYAAFPTANAHGVHIEMCHVGRWDLTDPVDAATFDNGAQVAARLCLDHGFPAHHLSVAELAGFETKGICGHWDVTRAYPADGGDHSDPDFSGGNPTGFPWATFIARVAGYMGSGPAPAPEGDEMDRYVFSDKWGVARPGDMGTHVIVTDRLGRFWQEPFSLPGQGMATVIDPANGWDFGRMFSELTGGCVMTADAAGHSAKFGVNAAMFPPASSAGGGGLVDHTHPFSGTVSGSVSGLTGSAQPVA